MDFGKMTPVDLLGPLNEVESKYAPEWLYVAGDEQRLKSSPRVSIVGSRKASSLGLERAEKLSTLLASRGVTVVSGLAEGIDAASHRAAIEAGGSTVGVIGTPLDQFYPKSNKALQERMMQEQLVLSQFAIGTPIQRHNFPMRNRIMALISDATVIAEAGDSSGSLSQGWEALRLGRPLFIAYSVVMDKSLTWPSEMLGYGAIVLSNGTLDDLFDRLPARSGAELSNADSL